MDHRCLQMDGVPRDWPADVVEPTDEELALMEAPVPRSELPRVWRFWDQLISQELAAGAREAKRSQPTSWLSMSEEEKAQIRPSRRTSTGTVLRLIRGEGRITSHISGGEAA